jgi:molybdopterin/thiamine biosynthesis adenylyltransferase
MAEDLQTLLERVVVTRLSNSSAVELSTFTPSNTYSAAREGEIILEGVTAHVRVALPARFPLELPTVWLLNLEDRLIPHLEDRRVCYLEVSGLVFDKHNPEGLLTEAFEAALTTLREGISGRNHDDFLREFSTYWLRASRHDTIIKLAVNPDDRLRKIVSFYDNRKRLFVADNREVLRQLQASRSLKNLTEQAALYVPLQDRLVKYPPLPKHPWTLKYIQQIVKDGLTKANKKELRRVAKTSKNSELVILGVPRKDRTKTLVAIEFTGTKGLHPLIGGEAKEMSFLTTQRFDHTHLMPRGGASVTLTGKHVLFIGCGTVGGHLPQMFASAGVGRISLVDHDFLLPENTFRHNLGYNLSRGNPYKVDAVQERIHATLPYVHVETYPKRIEEVLEKQPNFMSQFDLVVVALGEPTLELRINEIAHAQPKTPPIIFTWLEPLGIGGHAIAVNVGPKGCLECLYEPSKSAERPLANRAAFADYGQNFQENLDGCGGTFTSFSYLDGIKTAELTARLGVQVLKGEIQENTIVSWKGSSVKFERAGYKVSRRYTQPDTQLVYFGEEFQRQDCLVCGAKV